MTTLRRISLTNFKSFRRASMRVAQLTLISGENGSGKSTIIQSVLLAKQIDFSAAPPLLHCNGDYVHLGSAENVLHEWTNDDFFEAVLTFTTGSLRIHHSTTAGSASDTLNVEIAPQFGREISACLRYLGAERVGPADVFRYSTDQNARRDIGIRGEFAVAYLAANKSSRVSIPGVCHPDDHMHGLTGTLGANVNAWLQKISPGVSVDAARVSTTGASLLTYGYRTAEPIDGLSSFNVGFGLTYVLPVVMLVLSAKPEDVLLLENPESHIHPAGQIALGEMLAQAADAGVQIILETHSDHVFNGIRLYIKRKKAALRKYAFIFAQRESTRRGFRTGLAPVQLFPNGKIKSAPKGFFDAWETAVFKLI